MPPKRSARSLKPFGLTLVKLNYLMIVKHIGKEEGLSQREIARPLLIDAGNVTHVLDDLEKKGWVVRYVCSNSNCRFKLPQEEAERAARELVVGVLREDRLLEKIVRRTNELLLQELPKLLRQRQERQQQLTAINAQAQKIMDEYLNQPELGPFAKDRLTELAEQRRAVETGLATLSQMVDDIEERAIDRVLIEKLLKSFDEIFGEDLKPYQRKELLRWTIQRIQVSDREIRAAVKIHRPAPQGDIGLPTTLMSPQAVGSGSFLLAALTVPAGSRVNRNFP